MFELIFGLLWTTCSAFCMTLFILVGGEEMPIWVFLFMSLFLIIGIVILIIGIKTVIRNASTSKKGEICYGKVINIYPTGSYINDQPLLKADFAVCLPFNEQMAVISEVIGVNTYRCPVGSYCKLKYYNNDINIIEKVSQEEVPLNVVDIIGYKTVTEDAGEDIIEVDGKRYMRID